jgi:protein ImuA
MAGENTLAALRRRVNEIERACPFGSGGQAQAPMAANDHAGQASGIQLGVPDLDIRFTGNRWPSWGCHEVAGAEAGDRPAAMGFGFALAALLQHQHPDGRVLIVREAALVAEHGALHAPGLHALGLDPDRILTVVTRTGADALRVIDDALMTPDTGLVAVLGDLERGQSLLNLASTRRLNLAARRAQIAALLLTSGLTGTSASLTRWTVRASASVDIFGSGSRRYLGRPGRTGACTLEWNSHVHAFAPLPTVSAPVVQPPVDGPGRAHPFVGYQRRTRNLAA